MFTHLRTRYASNLRVLLYPELERVKTAAFRREFRSIIIGSHPSLTRCPALSVPAVLGPRPQSCSAKIWWSPNRGQHTDHERGEGMAPALSTDNVCLPSSSAAGKVKIINNSQPQIDFSQAEIIFNQKSSFELARSFLVLQMCSFNYFVDNSLKLMNLGNKVLGRTLFTALMRGSFYGQFAASPKSVRQVAEKFKEGNIAPMLATTAEEEVGNDPNQINEEKYERNVETMLECLDMQAEVAMSNQPILSQLKMTSYIKADVLEKLSTALEKQNFDFVSENPVSVANFRTGLDGDLQPIPALSDVEMAHLQHALRRLDTIVQRAVERKVRILVDAEYVCVNPAMSLITFALMKKYNSNHPQVWNTYQCYLKSALRSLERGLEVADSEGFQFGVKVVRGAYMDYERGVAKKTGKRDPVNETYNATNEMFDSVIARLMGLVYHRGGNRINFIIATHNTNSVAKAVKRMWELDLSPTDGAVVFGQLMGMCDHVSYGLGQAGYLTYKSVPFGSLEDVMPNMSRRAVENKTVFHRLQQEKSMLRHEIARRLLPWR